MDRPTSTCCAKRTSSTTCWAIWHCIGSTSCSRTSRRRRIRICASYSHPLGKSEPAWYAPEALVATASDNFPRSLSRVPVLLPTSQLRAQRLDRRFEREGIPPMVTGNSGQRVARTFAPPVGGAPGPRFRPVPDAPWSPADRLMFRGHGGALPDMHGAQGRASAHSAPFRRARLRFARPVGRLRGRGRVPGLAQAPRRGPVRRRRARRQPALPAESSPGRCTVPNAVSAASGCSR